MSRRGELESHSEEENVPERGVKVNTFRWRLLELRPNANRAETVLKKSEIFKCKVDAPAKEMRFKLTLCMKQTSFVVGILNLEKHDAELNVGTVIEVAGGMTKRQSPRQCVATKGGTHAKTILHGQTRELFGVPNPWERQDISLSKVDIVINILVPNRYDKPNFLDSSMSVKRTTSLVNDMRSAFKNEVSADLTIICVDNNEDGTTSSNSKNDKVVEKAKFKVQRGILALRSKVFASMFSGNFSESNSDTLPICDMSPKALKKFLLYLYTDSFHAGGKVIAEELLAAADKYDVAGLKVACEEELCQDLDDESVCRVAGLAFRFNAASALKFSVEQLVNNFHHVVKTDSWRDLVSHGGQELLDEIHKQVAKMTERLSRKRRHEDEPSSSRVARYLEDHQAPRQAELEGWDYPNLVAVDDDE